MSLQSILRGLDLTLPSLTNCFHMLTWGDFAGLRSHKGRAGRYSPSPQPSCSSSGALSLPARQVCGEQGDSVPIHLTVCEEGIACLCSEWAKEREFL